MLTSQSSSVSVTVYVMNGRKYQQQKSKMIEYLGRHSITQERRRGKQRFILFYHIHLPGPPIPPNPPNPALPGPNPPNPPLLVGLPNSSNPEKKSPPLPPIPGPPLPPSPPPILKGSSKGSVGSQRDPQGLFRSIGLEPVLPVNISLSGPTYSPPPRLGLGSRSGGSVLLGCYRFEKSRITGISWGLFEVVFVPALNLAFKKPIYFSTLSLSSISASIFTSLNTPVSYITIFTPTDFLFSDSTNLNRTLFPFPILYVKEYTPSMSLSQSGGIQHSVISFSETTGFNSTRVLQECRSTMVDWTGVRLGTLSLLQIGATSCIRLISIIILSQV